MMMKASQRRTMSVARFGANGFPAVDFVAQMVQAYASSVYKKCSSGIGALACSIFDLVFSAVCVCLAVRDKRKA